MPGSKRPARPGSSRDRDLRRHRRPGQAKAAPRAVPPGCGRPAARALSHRGHCSFQGHLGGRLQGARPCCRRRVRHRRAERAGLAHVRGRPVLRRRRPGRPVRARRGSAACREGDRRSRAATVPPRHSPDRLRVDHRDAGRLRSGRGRPGDHREAVRHRPGLGPSPGRHGPSRVRRVSGLSDRPLPGEGVGRQHLGVPLRQRPLRTGLEQGTHRVRADRRPREAVDRGAGCLLRRHRGLPGHGRQPPVPSPRLRRHGASDQPLGQGPA